MAKSTTSGSPKYEIRVAPDQTAPAPEPLVLLSQRDLHTSGGSTKILWKKLPASKKFKMVSLVDNSGLNVLKNIVISGNKRRITCDFEPPTSGASGVGYEYTLTIKFKGTEYDTDERTGPNHGRPVIRN